MRVSTVTYVSYDANYVYVAFECGGPETGSVPSGALRKEDFELFLMPTADRNNYFQICVTPEGTHDAFWAGKKLSADRMGIQVATSMQTNAWLAEIAIPFAVLQTTTPASGSVWKVCLAHTRREISFETWPLLSGCYGYHDVDSFAELIFNGDPQYLHPAATDHKLSVRPVSTPIMIDGIIEAEWRSAACITAFVPLPVHFDPRLKKNPPGDQIEKLIAGRYKDQGHTTALTREDIARARRLIAEQDWARSVFAGIKKIADHWRALSDDELYELIPVESPMAYCVCYSYGCPVCGADNRGFTTTALRTSLSTPNRWQCTTCQRWFGPQSEMEYKGQTYTIHDNGTGWMVPDGLPGAGHTCYFVGAWRNYLLGILLGTVRAKHLTIAESDAPLGGLGALATVYAVTGEICYAHKALLILARIAQLHPAYDGVIDIGNSAMMPHIAWTTAGAEEVLDACARSYDLVFEQLAGDDELAAFFRKKGHPDLDGDGSVTPWDIRRSIALNLFGYMYEWLLRNRRHSAGDDWTLGHCGDMVLIGRLLQNPAIVQEALAAEKGFYALMIERHLNDGRFFYNSLYYHFGKVSYFGKVLSTAWGYSEGNVFKLPLNLFADETLPYARLLDYACGLLCTGRIPGIGDQVIPRQKTGPGNEILLASFPFLLPYFPSLARIWKSREALLATARQHVSDALPQHVLERIADIPVIEKTVAEAGDYQPQRTRLFTDSGLAILRTDTDGLNQVHALLNYGIDGSGHSHRDQLALNIIAHGYEFTINKGYPYTWNRNVKVPSWVHNSAAQNIVRIDGVNQTAHNLIAGPVMDCAGLLHAFADNPLVAMADGSNEKVYPGLAEQYRRAALLIKDPEHPFVVDICCVKGGHTRDYQFHGQSDILGQNFSVTLEDGATLQSAASVPQYIDSRFISDIHTVKTSGGLKAHWWIGDEDNTGLMLYMLAGSGARLVITGKGQAEGDDKPVPCDGHLTVREEGDRSSRFVCVLFPYCGQPPNAAMRHIALPVAASGRDNAAVLQVVVSNRSYLVFYDPDGDRLHTVKYAGHSYTFCGKLGVIAEQNDSFVSACLSDGIQIGRDDEVFRSPAIQIGMVTAVNLPERSIVVRDLANGPEPGMLLKWVDKPWVYRVLEKENTEMGLKLHLDTFALLDKGRYPMVADNDRVFVLNTIYAYRNEYGNLIATGGSKL